MPQGLPKKIEVALLLADLALQLGDALPRCQTVVEQRAAQRRTIQLAAPRPAGATQRLQPTAPRNLLPLVHPPPVDPKICRHSRHCLASRHPAHRRPFNLCRYVQSSFHQFLSLRETVRSFHVSLLGSTPSLVGVTLAETAETPGEASERVVLASAAPRRPAARAGAHAAKHAAVLHAAEMHADIGAGSLAGQLELVGLEAADLVADARGLLEFEVGGGVAHALLELGDVAAQIVADQVDVARHAGVDRVMVALGGRLQDLVDVLLDR